MGRNGKKIISQICVPIVNYKTFHDQKTNSFAINESLIICTDDATKQGIRREKQIIILEIDPNQL